MRIPMNFLIAMSLLFLTACGGNTFITKISASSELSEGGVIFAVENLIDGNAASSWVVRGDKSGIGSNMVICFNKKISLGKIGFINGFGRPEYWSKNNRVKRIRITNERNEIAYVDLDDVNTMKTYIPDKKIDGSKFTFTISDVFKGDTYDDTAISEIVINPDDDIIRTYGANSGFKDIAVYKTDTGAKKITGMRPETMFAVISTLPDDKRVKICYEVSPGTSVTGWIPGGDVFSIGGRVLKNLAYYHYSKRVEHDKIRQGLDCNAGIKIEYISRDYVIVYHQSDYDVPFNVVTIKDGKYGALQYNEEIWHYNGVEWKPSSGLNPPAAYQLTYIDGDNVPDVVELNSGADWDTLTIYINNRNGGFHEILRSEFATDVFGAVHIDSVKSIVCKPHDSICIDCTIFEKGEYIQRKVKIAYRDGKMVKI